MFRKFIFECTLISLKKKEEKPNTKIQQKKKIHHEDLLIASKRKKTTRSVGKEDQRSKMNRFRFL